MDLSLLVAAISLNDIVWVCDHPGLTLLDNPVFLEHCVEATCNLLFFCIAAFQGPWVDRPDGIQCQLLRASKRDPDPWSCGWVSGARCRDGGGDFGERPRRQDLHTLRVLSALLISWSVMEHVASQHEPSDS